MTTCKKCGVGDLEWQRQYQLQPDATWKRTGPWKLWDSEDRHYCGVPWWQEPWYLGVSA
jgi:hypothetical protein